MSGLTDALVLELGQTESGLPFLATHPTLGPRLDMLPLYDLEHTNLLGYRALLIGLHADQRYLATRRAQLEAFLAAGRVVVFCGHVAEPFLPELQPFQPIEGYTLDDLDVVREAEHPVWDGVAVEDLSRRRGVAGFYGRGANPPPAGATVIHTLGPNRAPVDFIHRPAAGGWLLVHAGADLWNYAPDATTAGRIAPQLIDWAAQAAEGRA